MKNEKTGVPRRRFGKRENGCEKDSLQSVRLLIYDSYGLDIKVEFIERTLGRNI